MSIKQTTKIGSVPASSSVRIVEPKTIAAVVLISLMAVLWGRVLLRSKAGPASAAAAAVAVEEAQQQNIKSQIQIQAIPLTPVAGRHDTIAADFFRADRSAHEGGRQSSAGRSTRDEENLKMLDELRKAMTLEAVIKNAQGVAEKAYINGTVVTLGSTLGVEVQENKCIVRVEAIEPAGVRLSWQDRTFMLKMPEQ
jgi:hypothetical protein